MQIALQLPRHRGYTIVLLISFSDSSEHDMGATITD